MPCRNTIYEYFGKHGLASGLIECERTLRNVFPCFNEGQKCCFISFDEMHIKPGWQYQGKYLIGNDLITDQPLPAKSVLASMINPCFGAPAFVVRLIPVLHLKGEFLNELLISLINLTHEVGGYVLKASLYYICGYIARKEGIVCDDKPPESLPESEFTEKLSRGGILFPPIDL